MTTTGLLLLTLLASPPPSEATSFPTDVSGVARGAAAVGFDPAAPALADGLELQLRTRLDAEEIGLNRTALAAVFATRWLGVHGGFEWRHIPGERHHLLSLGLAARLTDRAALGFTYRRFFSAKDAYDGVDLLDLGAAAELGSFLSVSAGVDAVNAPRLSGARLPPALRIGAAVRPLRGSPLLAIGADARWHLDPYDLWSARLLADVGWEGARLFGAWEPQEGRVWLGLSVAILGAELAGATVPSGFERNRDGWGDAAVAVTMRQRPRESLFWPGGRTVEVALSGELRSSPEGPFDLGPAISTSALDLTALARDPTVERVIIDVGDLDVGLASVEELRRAVLALRQAGKRVVAEVGNITEKGYLIAAAADEIVMDPSGVIRLDGFAITQHYFGEALARLGIRFESVEIGRYKSAPDALTRAAPRPEEREVKGQILAQAMALLQRALREGRGLGPEEAKALLARGAFTGPEALAAQLVDRLTQPTDPAAVPAVRELGEALERRTRPDRRWGGRPRVAVVPVSGTIVTRAEESPLPGPSADAGTIVAALEQATDDTRVAAVVVRIDSGGGDVFAAELIWRAVRRLSEVKPVVVSMGDVAASGGYYVACGAPIILAEASTLTGSIGIFAVRPDLQGLLAKLGVHAEVFKEGEHADWDSWSRPMVAAERARLTELLGSYYDTFVGRVAFGRKLSTERALALAEGRVFTGEEAVSLGLVDALGGLADAVREAAARAGLEAGEVEVSVPDRAWSLPAMVENAVTSPPSLISASAEALRRIRAWEDRPLALWPLGLEVGR